MAPLPLPAKDHFVGTGHEISKPPITPAPVPDAMAMFEAFRRRWPLAIGGGLIASLIVTAVAWFAVPPAKYMAIGTLRVAMMRPKILFNTAEQEAEYQIFQKTQTALIKSRYVLDAVIRDPDVAKLETMKELVADQIELAEWLEKEVVVEFANKSEVLHVSMSGDHPHDVETIANKVIEMYMKMVIESDGSDRKVRVETLRQLWDRYQESLKAKRGSLRKLALAAGSDDKQTLSMKGQLAHEQLAMAEAERTRNRSELNRIQTELTILDSVRESVNQPPATEEDQATLDQFVETQLNGDSYVKELKAYIKKMSERYESARRIARDSGDPSVVAARAKLDSARKSLSARRDELRPILASRLRNGATDAGRPGPDPARNVEILKKKAEIFKQFDRDLTADVERLKGEIRSLNENTLDLQTEQDEILMLAETARKVGTEVEAMDVELRAPERIRVIDRAKAPRVKDDLKKIRVTGLAAVGAFASFLLGVTFWEVRARRVSSPDEVEKNLGLRLVGALPALHGRPGALNASSDRRWQSVLIESVDATRTMLLHASRVDSIRVVMVSSAVAGEGKSSLSCHLAASLARAGRQTLLIDCDLRRPSVHRLFDQPQGPGVGELLRGEVGMPDVIRKSHAANLDLITAGRWDEHAVQALARGDLQAIFDGLRARYDFVIVDSAPILPVVDSLLVGQHVDAVIFSILRDVSRIPSVQEARDRLAALGVRVLGAVVSGIRGESYNQRYSLAQLPDGSQTETST